MAYPMQMPMAPMMSQAMPMPRAMPMPPRAMSMQRPMVRQSSDYSGLILILVCLAITLGFAGFLIYLQLQSVDETSELDCSIHNADETMCNSSENCYWDNDLFSCEMLLDDNNNNNNNFENSTVTTDTILTTQVSDLPRCLENERVRNNMCIPCSTYPDGSQKSTKRAGDDPNGTDTKCIESRCKENYHVHNESCVKCPNNTIRPSGDDPYAGDTKCMRPACSLNQKILCNEQEEEDPLFSDISSAFATNEPSYCNINTELWEAYCEGDSTLNEFGKVTDCPNGCRYIEESISDTEIQSSCIPNTQTIPGCVDFDGTRESCESISNLCLYVPSTEEQNTIDEKSQQNVTRCNCQDCEDGMESEILHDISPDDDNAETTQCVVQGLGASTLYPCKPTQKAENGQCIDCPGPNNVDEPSDVQMYGCPTNRDSPQPGTSDCIHTHAPSDLPVNYTGNVCRRPPCKDYEKLTGDSINGFVCENCGLDEIGNTNMSSKEHTISPDLAMDIDKTICSTSEQLQEMLSGYCAPHDMNSQWEYEEYIEWSNKEYAIESNKANWLPTHQYLRESMNNFKYDGTDTNMTNKDVYFPSFINPKYKYSYLKNGSWIHLCDCPSTDASQSHKENGFVNCKCSQSQYFEHSLDGSGSDTCKNIESPCYTNGNYFDNLRMIEGQFWNIKDPFCNFFKSNQSVDDEDIQERCCVGCSHKVYKGGVPSEENKFKNNPPDYAANWYNQRSSTGAEKSIIRFDDTWDPILIGQEDAIDRPYSSSEWSPGTIKNDWRQHDLSIGFNSRPLYFYPKLNGSGDPIFQDANGNSGSTVDFPLSQDALITGNGSFTDEDFPGDSGCGQDNCDTKSLYRWMTSNIFTCKRTNPNESQSQSLSIPDYGVVGDEPFYDIKGKSLINKTTLEQSKNSYTLEYPGKKKWVINTGWERKPTPIKETVLKGKKIPLSNEQVEQGVNDLVSNGAFTVGDTSLSDNYTLVDVNRCWRYNVSGSSYNSTVSDGEDLGCQDNKSLEEAEQFCDNLDNCYGFWKENPTSGTSRTCFKGTNTTGVIHAYNGDISCTGANIVKKSFLNDSYKQLYTNGSPQTSTHTGVISWPAGAFKETNGARQFDGSKCLNIEPLDGPRTTEEIIDQCAALCSSDRIKDGYGHGANCEGFFVYTDGSSEGRCCPKIAGFNGHKSVDNGVFFERTVDRPVDYTELTRTGSGITGCPLGWQTNPTGISEGTINPPTGCQCPEGTEFSVHPNRLLWRCI